MRLISYFKLAWSQALIFGERVKKITRKGKQRAWSQTNFEQGSENSAPPPHPQSLPAAPGPLHTINKNDYITNKAKPFTLGYSLIGIKN